MCAQILGHGNLWIPLSIAHVEEHLAAALKFTGARKGST